MASEEIVAKRRFSALCRKQSNGQRRELVFFNFFAVFLVDLLVQEAWLLVTFLVLTRAFPVVVRFPLHILFLRFCGSSLQLCQICSHPLFFPDLDVWWRDVVSLLARILKFTCGSAKMFTFSLFHVIFPSLSHYPLCGKL